MVLYAIVTLKGEAKSFSDAVDELETHLETIDNANTIFQAEVVKVGNDSWRAVAITGQ